MRNEMLTRHAVMAMRYKKPEVRDMDGHYLITHEGEMYDLWSLDGVNRWLEALLPFAVLEDGNEIDWFETEDEAQSAVEVFSEMDDHTYTIKEA